MLKSIIQADYIGAITSSICLVHCLISPFVFIMWTSSPSIHCCSSTPIWWRSLDYIFLAISFLAIYTTTKSSTNTWLSLAFWFSWFVLTLILLNEKFSWISITDKIIYIPTVSITLLHLYKLKYCKCKQDTCCTNMDTI